MHYTRHAANKMVYESIEHKWSNVFYLANQMRKENGVEGDKPEVKNDAEEMSMSNETKQALRL